jgi:hypothetical protein
LHFNAIGVYINKTIILLIFAQKSMFIVTKIKTN